MRRGHQIGGAYRRVDNQCSLVASASCDVGERWQWVREMVGLLGLLDAVGEFRIKVDRKRSSHGGPPADYL